MPYNSTTQKKYGENPLTMKTGPFKMKGWSPLTKKELTKEQIVALANKQKEDAIQRNIKEGGTRKQATEQYKRNIK